MIFACDMTEIRRFNIKANSEEEAMEWINTHDFSDIPEHFLTEYDYGGSVLFVEDDNAEYCVDLTKERK